MKYTVYLLALLTTIAGSGCRDLECPAFDENERNNWLPHEAGTTLTFQQESNLSTATFAVKRVKATGSYREKSRGIYGPRDCEASASVEMNTDTSVAMKPGYTLSIASISIEAEEQWRDLSYQLGDFNGSFQTYPLLKMPHTETTKEMERDSIVSTLVLGGKTYSNVVIQSRNPLDSSMTYQVQKVYLAPGYGIIGFVSKGKRYYRK